MSACWRSNSSCSSFILPTQCGTILILHYALCEWVEGREEVKKEVQQVFFIMGEEACKLYCGM